jgi:hypothetical protein
MEAFVQQAERYEAGLEDGMRHAASLRPPQGLCCQLLSIVCAFHHGRVSAFPLASNCFSVRVVIAERTAGMDATGDDVEGEFTHLMAFSNVGQLCTPIHQAVKRHRRR